MFTTPSLYNGHITDFLCTKHFCVAQKRAGTFIFEETLFTKKIKRFPFFCVDKTLMDKYLPADDLRGETENEEIR